MPVEVNAECICCGKGYLRRASSAGQHPSKYCSRDCYLNVKRESSSKAVCLKCGKSFRCPQAHINRGRKYCSRACFGAAYAEPRRKAKTCEECGIDFTIKKYEEKSRPARFCSPQCRGRHHSKQPGTQVVLECPVCAKTFKRIPALASPGSSCCSRLCANKLHSTRMRQSGNPNYQHGRGWEPYDPGFAAISRAIRKMDGCCVVCGAKAALHCHHIDHDKRNNDPRNLVTLCNFCHPAYHRSFPEQQLVSSGLFKAVAFNRPPFTISRSKARTTTSPTAS